MAGRRYTIDMFFDEAAFQAIPSAKKLAFRDTVRALKTYASKVEGIEITTQWHICRHDEKLPCDESQDI